MKESIKFNLILGSKSPRRKELLSWLDIPFQIHVSNILEKSSELNPANLAMDIAAQKGLSVLEKLNLEKHLNPLVVGADTIVCLDNKILGKPDDRDDAKKMLLCLSGKTHEVVTGVWIGACFLENKLKEQRFFCSTKVHFKKIDNDLLDIYLNSGDSLDKAGAYGIQGQSLTFIDSIEGSYSNVVGFPLDMFVDELKFFLGCQNYFNGEWRKLFDKSSISK